MTVRQPAIMFPHVGAGGGRLKPKNERVPSMTIIHDMPSTTIAEIGATRTFPEVCAMSDIPPKADIRVTHRHVCFGPIGDTTFIQSPRRRELMRLFDGRHRHQSAPRTRAA